MKPVDVALLTVGKSAPWWTVLARWPVVPLVIPLIGDSRGEIWPSEARHQIVGRVERGLGEGWRVRGDLGGKGQGGGY